MMKKVISTFQALMLVLLIFSPVVSADEREQSIDINFTSPVDSPYRQNLLSKESITLNMDTWAIQPEGVYSGPILAENLIEFEYQIRPNQINENIEYKGKHGFVIEGGVSPAFDEDSFLGVTWEYGVDKSCNQFDSERENMKNNTYVHPLFPVSSPEGECFDPFISESNDGIEDPYGNDDLMRNVQFSREPLPFYAFESDVRAWGPDTYTSYFSVSVPIQFSHEEIMSGASEFWVRSPIDGYYNTDSSYVSIFEIDDLSYNDYDVDIKTIFNDTVVNMEWDEPLAYNPPGIIKNTEISHANGTLIYENTLNGHEALVFDYTEANCLEVANGSHDASNGGTFYDPYIVSNGKRMGSTDSVHGRNTDDYHPSGDPFPYVSHQEMVQFFCPESNHAHFTSDTVPVESSQTLITQSLVHPDYNRTYHKVNTFIYPNQPYLFVFFLELKASNPLLALTSEDVNGQGTETLIKYGEYNFSNPYDGKELKYYRNPYNHFYNEDRISLDTGTSFVFTQGQSKDMAGYRINADNTTISFMKELPEPISHEPGPDGVFDLYDGDVYSNDDELDFVSIYLPFINHDKKDITIEYVAMAYEIQEDGDIFLKQWLNSSRLDYKDDDNYGTHGSLDDPYAHQCRYGLGAVNTNNTTRNEGWEYIEGYGCNGINIDPNPDVPYEPQVPFTESAHNYYYSGFWYFGYPKEGISVKGDSTHKTLTHTTADSHCFDFQDGFAEDDWDADEYTFCRSEAFQRRGGALNDANAHVEYHRKQYKDYFLHTSELVPQNGTTHILYQFKIAGIHHWQANLENVCFLCDGTDPWSNAEYSRNHDGDELYPITKFPTELDSNKDGRTDVNCEFQPCQGNSTDITLLIQKPSVAPSELRVPLPFASTGINTTCLFRQDPVQYTESSTNLFTNLSVSNETQSKVCPYRYTAPLNSWSVYQENWDRNGKFIDGSTHLLKYSSLSGGFAWVDCYSFISLLQQSINPTGWNGIKQCVGSDHQREFMSLHKGNYSEGCGVADDVNERFVCGWSGKFETNARGSSYISVSDYEYHATELMASATITSGRWTEVKGTMSGGVDFLDNTFRHKVVQRNVYELTIVTSTYELPECPQGTVEFDNLRCISEEEMALVNGYHGSVEVLGRVGDACNPVEIVNGPTSWDLTWDYEWGACSSAIKNALVGAAQYDWGTLVDGAQVLGGQILDRFYQLSAELKDLGKTIVNFVADAIGKIYSLFHEIGAHLDEFVATLMYLAGLIGLSFFLQLVVRFGTTILIALENRGVS